MNQLFWFARGSCAENCADALRIIWHVLDNLHMKDARENAKMVAVFRPELMMLAVFKIHKLNLKEIFDKKCADTCYQLWDNVPRFQEFILKFLDKCYGCNMIETTTKNDVMIVLNSLVSTNETFLRITSFLHYVMEIHNEKPAYGKKPIKHNTHSIALERVAKTFSDSDYYEGFCKFMRN